MDYFFVYSIYFIINELSDVEKYLTPLQIGEVAKKRFRIEIQRKEFIKNEYEVKQLQIYRQNKPIYWPPSLSTSLAEAELEYREQICL
ncbi:isoleucyl-tRNA synthetase [Rhizophagus irregularis DAOM 181602=DAOM 197198]|nr:isoleucyl-tRNA synthetase [Rhizophagus irregularis DAOM 181602=DAOM 197198]